MADPISDEDYLAANPQYAGLDPAIRTQLRRSDQLAADLESERANRIALERRAAFAEAGLADLPHRELFEKTYEGEMTVEAIKAEAAKYSLVPTATAPAVDNRVAGLEGLRRSEIAIAGPATGAPMDFGDALDRARSPEEWEAIMANAPAEAGIRLPRTVQGSRLI